MFRVQGSRLRVRFANTFYYFQGSEEQVLENLELKFATSEPIEPIGYISQLIDKIWVSRVASQRTSRKNLPNSLQEKEFDRQGRPEFWGELLFGAFCAIVPASETKGEDQ